MLAMLLLVFFPSLVPLLFAMAAIYGAANGVMTILRGTSVPDLLGRDGFGAISGALTLPASIAAAIAPSLARLARLKLPAGTIEASSLSTQAST